MSDNQSYSAPKYSALHITENWATTFHLNKAPLDFGAVYDVLVGALEFPACKVWSETHDREAGNQDRVSKTYGFFDHDGLSSLLKDGYLLRINPSATAAAQGAIQEEARKATLSRLQAERTSIDKKIAELK